VVQHPPLGGAPGIATIRGRLIQSEPPRRPRPCHVTEGAYAVRAPVTQGAKLMTPGTGTRRFRFYRVAVASNSRARDASTVWR
jgi:hypothetical protein